MENKKLETVYSAIFTRESATTVVRREPWTPNTVSYARDRLKNLKPIRGEFELRVGESALAVIGLLDGKYFAFRKL